jgi:antitoxin YefM
MTRILVMSETRSLADVKAHLSEIVDLVEGQHERVVITRHGRPAAIIMSVQDLESLEETLEILSAYPVLSRRFGPPSARSTAASI